MAAIACFSRSAHADEPGKTVVALVKAADRTEGIRKAVGILGALDFQGKHVYLKCNYNSADPFPATTHPDALRAAAGLLRSMGAAQLTVVERSGMGLTRSVVERLGALEEMRKSGMAFLPLEELPQSEWTKVDLPGSHWKDGVEAPRFLTGPSAPSNTSTIVQLCNLKTHRFGGEFSASLKNSIGLIAKRSAGDPRRNYMAELHSSPNQPLMIAEVNQIYRPELAVMDAMQVFIKGGPDAGEIAAPGVIVASRDRVALDAVGLAILRLFGAGEPISRMRIFEQPQLKRAVVLGLGVGSGKEIELIAEGGEESRILASRIRNLLVESPDSPSEK